MQKTGDEKICHILTLIGRFVIHSSLIFCAFWMYCCEPYEEWGSVNDGFLFMAYFLWLMSIQPTICAGIFYGVNWREKWYISIVLDILLVLYITYKFVVCFLIGFGILVPANYII